MKRVEANDKKCGTAYQLLKVRVRVLCRVRHNGPRQGVKRTLTSSIRKRYNVLMNVGLF